MGILQNLSGSVIAYGDRPLVGDRPQEGVAEGRKPQAPLIEFPGGDHGNFIQKNGLTAGPGGGHFEFQVAEKISRYGPNRIEGLLQRGGQLIAGDTQQAAIARGVGEGVAVDPIQESDLELSRRQTGRGDGPHVEGVNTLAELDGDEEGRLF